ncbi:MAG: cell shape determination protein CcmA [Acidobacteria bacterium]|nr:MAG: cell shape determination protein CcmA [Acidobacteriota bacterium]
MSRCLMWKKDDAKILGVAENSAAASGFARPLGSDSSNSFSDSPRASASISQGIRIKGEVTGTEDLFVDGYVEGKLNLTADSCLTVGPNGNVKADLVAREIVVRGKVEGKVIARDKLQIGSTGEINGEVQTGRLAIEDGATLRGKVEAGKVEMSRSAETKTAAAAAAAATTTKPSAQPAFGSETAAD